MRTIFTIIALLLSAHAAAQIAPYAILGAAAAKTDAAGNNTGTLAAFAGIGLTLNKSLAFEATYIDLDTRKDHRNSDTTTSPAGGGALNITTVSKEWKGKGTGIFAVGRHGLSPSAALVGKLGAYRLTGKTQETTTNSLVPASTAPIITTATNVSANERIWTPTIGFGIEERANDRIAFRAMFEQVNGRSGDFKRSRMLSAALVISF